MRAETGLIKFGDDWRGVFIRGDTAYMFAQSLKLVLADCSYSIFKQQIEQGLLDLLEGADERKDALDFQQLLPYKDCVK